MKGLDNKVALVKGGAKGLGEATARRLSAGGARVVIADIDVTAGEAMAAELGGTFIRTDVTQEPEVEAAVKMAVNQYGKLDVMVNNAGLIGAVGSIMEISSTDWRRTMAILLDGMFFGVKHAARVMREQQDGLIVCMSSVAGITGGVGPHAYAVAKRGIVGLTLTAAAELAPHNIRVNAIAPGEVLTPMVVALRGGDAVAAAHASGQTGLASLIDADEIGAMIGFLASDDGRHINAQVIAIDSGHSTIGNRNPPYHQRPSRFLGGGGQL